MKKKIVFNCILWLRPPNGYHIKFTLLKLNSKEGTTRNQAL